MITRMNGHRIRLRENSQSHRVKYCMVLFTYHPYNDKIRDTKNRLVGNRSHAGGADKCVLIRGTDPCADGNILCHHCVHINILVVIILHDVNTC